MQTTLSHKIAGQGQTVVAIRDAILAEEISNLLEYVLVDGIDPAIFEEVDRLDLRSTGAKVVYDLIVKLANPRTAQTRQSTFPAPGRA